MEPTGPEALDIIEDGTADLIGYGALFGRVRLALVHSSLG
jgi:hypothetical protein